MERGGGAEYATSKRFSLLNCLELSFESRWVRTCLFAPLAENKLVTPFKAGQNLCHSYRSNGSINNSYTTTPQKKVFMQGDTTLFVALIKGMSGEGLYTKSCACAVHST